MRLGIAWLEAGAVVTALSIGEIGALMLELRTSIISDWFISLAPLIWVNASVFFAYALLREIGLASRDTTGEPEGAAALLRPNFKAIGMVLRSRRSRYLWVATGSAYALLYALFQGIVFVDLSGSLLPSVNFLGGPIGYGPGLAWSPSGHIAVLIRPYTATAAVALALLSGLVLALFMFIVASGRTRVGALPAPVAGLTVVCPACLATPAAGLVTAYVAPAVSLAGLGTAYTFTSALALSTTLLLSSLVLLWLTLSWLSRMLVPD